MKRVTFRKPDFLGDYDVLVDGEVVGTVRKRSEWYGNLGHRGVRYHYWDFYLPRSRKKLVTNSSRKNVVAEALVKLGGKYDEVAREVDPDTANHYIRIRAER